MSPAINGSRDVRVGDEWAVRLSLYGSQSLMHGVVVLPGFYRNHGPQAEVGVDGRLQDGSWGKFTQSSVGRYVAMLVKKEGWTSAEPFYVSKTAVVRPWLDEHNEREAARLKEKAARDLRERNEKLFRLAKATLQRGLQFDFPDVSWMRKNGVRFDAGDLSMNFELDALLKLSEVVSSARQDEYAALLAERDSAVQRAEAAEERLRAIKFMLDR